MTLRKAGIEKIGEILWTNLGSERRHHVAFRI